MVIILGEIIFFSHLKLKSIVGALLDLVEIVGHTLIGSLKIGAGTEACNDDQNEEEMFHAACEITVFT